MDGSAGTSLVGLHRYPGMAVGRVMVEDEQAKGLDGFLANPLFG
jgi:hypothetical protein